jgi:hypothetical protein
MNGFLQQRSTSFAKNVILSILFWFCTEIYGKIGKNVCLRDEPQLEYRKKGPIDEKLIEKPWFDKKFTIYYNKINACMTALNMKKGNKINEKKTLSL